MTATTTQETCADRLRGALDSRMADLKCMYRAHETDNETLADFLTDQGIDLPELAEDETWDDHTDTLEENAREAMYSYGLGLDAFDYVTPGTFDNDAGYWRYQISYGGPSEELRFYGPDRVDFVFLDWFDSEARRLHGDDLKTAAAMWDDLDECGTIEQVRKDAEQ